MIFEETQRMTKLWWALAPVPIAYLLILAGQGEPVPVRGMVSSLLVLLVGEGLVALLFLAMKMQTRIDEAGISFRYSPLIGWRSITWEEIEKVWVRRYRPIREFGGWGIRSRIWKNNRAFNVWGNKGLQIQLINGRKVLLGTQKPKEMVVFLHQMKERYPLLPIERGDLESESEKRQVVTGVEADK